MGALALASVASRAVMIEKSILLARLKREVRLLKEAAAGVTALGAGLAARIQRAAQAGLALLATTGAVGPFVGLFGTVWGIMGSFQGIAQSHDTSLAVVAPGIAEVQRPPRIVALLAEAAAAMPTAAPPGPAEEEAAIRKDAPAPAAEPAGPPPRVT